MVANELSPDRVVNVASVPQRSPFRYPGGKTWLVPQIRRWLGSLPHRPALFVEPFCGGGIVSLTVAAEELADKLLMVELDAEVAAVWETILRGDAAWLAETIMNFNLTHESVQAVLKQNGDGDRRQRAFATIVRNRVLRGGILAPGSGLHKHGENGKGLLSRWYPETLSRRIRSIDAMRDRIQFRHADGLATIREMADRADALYFIDPPYTASTKRAGKRLYVHNELDHEELFQLVDGIASDFLMTYDDAPEIREMAAQYDFDIVSVAMRNTHLTEMRELLVGRNLGWARQELSIQPRLFESRRNYTAP